MGFHLPLPSEASAPSTTAKSSSTARKQAVADRMMVDRVLAAAPISDPLCVIGMDESRKSRQNDRTHGRRNTDPPTTTTSKSSWPPTTGSKWASESDEIDACTIDRMRTRQQHGNRAQIETVCAHAESFNQTSIRFDRRWARASYRIFNRFDLVRSFKRLVCCQRTQICDAGAGPLKKGPKTGLVEAGGGRPRAAPIIGTLRQFHCALARASIRP